MARISLVGLVFAVSLAMPSVSAPADTLCEGNVQDLNTMLPTLQLSGEVQREVEILEFEAGKLCEEGQAEEANLRVTDAWDAIINDSELTVPTVAELSTNSCTDGIAAVEKKAEASKA